MVNLAVGVAGCWCWQGALLCLGCGWWKVPVPAPDWWVVAVLGAPGSQQQERRVTGRKGHYQLPTGVTTVTRGHKWTTLTLSSCASRKKKVYFGDEGLNSVWNFCTVLFFHHANFNGLVILNLSYLEIIFIHFFLFTVNIFLFFLMIHKGTQPLDVDIFSFSTVVLSEKCTHHLLLFMFSIQHMQCCGQHFPLSLFFLLLSPVVIFQY